MMKKNKDTNSESTSSSQSVPADMIGSAIAGTLMGAGTGVLAIGLGTLVFGPAGGCGGAFLAAASCIASKPKEIAPIPAYAGIGLGVYSTLKAAFLVLAMNATEAPVAPVVPSAQQEQKTVQLDGQTLSCGKITTQAQHYNCKRF